MPHRIGPAGVARASLPLHGVAATRAIETHALAAHAPQALMQAAGRASAKWALALAPHARRVWVLCGPGHNGGDGFEAAFHLAQAGLAVQAWHHPGSGSATAPDAAAARQRALQAGVRCVAEWPGDAERADAVLDALLGFPSQRPMEGLLLEATRRFNAQPGLRLALDVPSGLCADTGRLFGTEVIRAQHTLSLLTLKPGLFTAHGRDAAGEIWLDELGCEALVAGTGPDARLGLGLECGAVSGDAGRRLHAHHKGSFGDCAIVGGSSGMAGAAALAARAALASGCGRVYVGCLEAGGNTLGYDPDQPELMFRPPWWLGNAEDGLMQASTVAGCGGGQAVAAALPALLRHCPRLVLDADALNAVSADAALARALRPHADWTPCSLRTLSKPPACSDAAPKKCRHNAGWPPGRWLSA
jgi:ADP-dependent NAD(P)H-hydrate dehydratase / NAD(P)H-hydrate epimerase